MSTLTLLPTSLGHNPLLQATARDYCNTPAIPMHMPARSSHGRSGTGIHYQLIPYFIKLLMASKPILSVIRLCNSCSTAHPCHCALVLDLSRSHINWKKKKKKYLDKEVSYKCEVFSREAHTQPHTHIPTLMKTKTTSLRGW